mmetsp:Transcript_127164/g.231042  ORF Transcript_127164/g.231042 Transcript_127164/m.231042 type:complete len:213 (-) Transcript_127164:522-1160(-)
MLSIKKPADEAHTMIKAPSKVKGGFLSSLRAAAPPVMAGKAAQKAPRKDQGVSGFMIVATDVITERIVIGITMNTRKANKYNACVGVARSSSLIPSNFMTILCPGSPATATTRPDILQDQTPTTVYNILPSLVTTPMLWKFMPPPKIKDAIVLKPVNTLHPCIKLMNVPKITAQIRLNTMMPNARRPKRPMTPVDWPLSSSSSESLTSIPST